MRGRTPKTEHIGSEGLPEATSWLIMASLFSGKTDSLHFNRYRGTWVSLLLSAMAGVVVALLLSTGQLQMAFSPTVFLKAGVPRLLPDFSRRPSTAKPSRGSELSDGIYLYGQSSRPEQLQKEYFIFELRQGKVIGAFYLPRSAFYCFWGTLTSAQLDVMVVDTFSQTTSPYSVNLHQYYRISEVSDNDQRILRQCKESYQQKIWEQ